ncbi:MAG: hypothetical protein ACI4DK_17020, partial [Lachnospiraceae bacterium]
FSKIVVVDDYFYIDIRASPLIANSKESFVSFVVPLAANNLCQPLYYTDFIGIIQYKSVFYS